MLPCPGNGIQEAGLHRYRNAGYILLFPAIPTDSDALTGDERPQVMIVGISDASAPFLSNAVIHTRYSEAVNFIGRKRTQRFLRAGATAPPNRGRGLPQSRRNGLRARTQIIPLELPFLYYLRHGYTGNSGYHHNRANRWDSVAVNFLFVLRAKTEAVRF